MDISKYKTILTKDGYLLNKKKYKKKELDIVMKDLTVEPHISYSIGVKNKVEDIVNARVSVITEEYEDRLKILEEKLRVRSEEILSNQERISITNEVHSLWMRANLESDYANKIEIFDEILKRKPEDVEAIAYKADALLEINQTAKAIDLCNQAIDIDSDYGYAYWQRACAFALIHEHADALADIKMALEYSPNLRNELLHESAFASLHDNNSFNTIVAGE